MTNPWVLTWARSAFIIIGRRNDPTFREHLAFDSQNEAVDFAKFGRSPTTNRATSFAERRYCRTASDRTDARLSTVKKRRTEARAPERLAQPLH